MTLAADPAAATRALVLAHWSLANARDWEGFARLLADDLVYEVPQTRERVIGRAGYTDFFATWPGTWRCEVRRCVAEPANAMTVIEFIGEAAPMTGLTLFDVRDGLIARITDYWPSPYEPEQRASAYVQRY
jgi:ketosteroid isomerase-like protein